MPSSNNQSPEVANVSIRTPWERVVQNTSGLTTNTSTLTTSNADFVATLSNALPQSVGASGRYVVKVAKGSLLQSQFYGQGADNAIGAARIWRWDTCKRPDGTVHWMRVLLWDGTFTLSTDVGIVGGAVDPDTRFADTITTTTDRTLRASAAIAPAAADNHRATLTIDTEGGVYIEYELSCNSSGTDPTAVGALFAVINGG